MILAIFRTRLINQKPAFLQNFHALLKCITCTMRTYVAQKKNAFQSLPILFIIIIYQTYSNESDLKRHIRKVFNAFSSNKRDSEGIPRVRKRKHICDNFIRKYMKFSLKWLMWMQVSSKKDPRVAIKFLSLGKCKPVHIHRRIFVCKVAGVCRRPR